MKLIKSILLSLYVLTIYSLADEKLEADKKHSIAQAKIHAMKCLEVYDVLRTKIKAGMTSAETSLALEDALWIKTLSSSEIKGLAGKLPVDFIPERAFMLRLYPNDNSRSNHVIYFSISCPKEYEIEFTMKDFFEGRIKSANVTINQFALCHPPKTPAQRGVIEVFPKK